MARNRYLDRRSRDMAMSRGGRDRAMDGHEKYAKYNAYIERQDDMRMGGRDRRNDYIPYNSYDSKPMGSSYDYNYDMRSDYNYDMRSDYGHHSKKGGEEKYHEDIEKWTEKLKRKDRFKVKKEDLISHAKQMGVRFDEFSEEEFYAVYLMMVSDYKAVANDFRSYLNMAKEWLEDDDIEVSPSEKLCLYYYFIVKGEGMDD